MTNCEQLKQELPRLRELANDVSAEEAAQWEAGDRVRFSSEIRWCVEALRELDARIKAASR